MSATTTVRNFDDGTITITDDGGNSATLAKIKGTYSITDLHPDGREAVTVQSQGAFIGDRRGNRVSVKVSITASVARFDETFYQILMGTVAGYVSTTADIGDGKRADIDISEDYSTDTRTWLLEDCRGTMSYQQSEGGAAEVTIELESIGPVSADGNVIIASR
jgi:hypothetical protein